MNIKKNLKVLLLCGICFATTEIYSFQDDNFILEDEMFYPNYNFENSYTDTDINQQFYIENPYGYDGFDSYEPWYSESYYEYNPYEQPYEEPLASSEFIFYPSNRLSFYFGLEEGYKVFRMPSFSYGFVGVAPPPNNDLTSIPFFDLEKDFVGDHYFGLFLGSRLPNEIIPNWLGYDPSIEISGNYFSQIKNKFFIGSLLRVPPDMFPFFFTLFTPFDAPIVTFGTGPGFLSLQREYSNKEVDLTFLTHYAFSFLNKPLVLEPFLGLGYNQLRQLYNVNVQTDLNLFPMFAKLLIDEDLRTDYLDFGGGLQIDYFPSYYFSLFLNAGIYGSYAHTKLDASQIFTSNFEFPLNPIVNVIDKKDVLTSKFKSSMGLCLYSGKMTISLLGNYEYWGYTPRIFNPVLVSIPVIGIVTVNPPQIANSYSYNYSIGLRLTVPFSILKPNLLPKS